ncbi:DUF309 domain-containing protein [Metabacillus arenae]|uniref:DUF309 domain-containing protein n=1 Tax=Metabacillus arenae TaxID=2771434 RepID=A0A926NIC4_9BACI|nr:DUF309 domain-containing protein [Metabacillus arenae]MBD1378672.1 DUF309 domain-containing protein [Metabacillus arenae]
MFDQAYIDYLIHFHADRDYFECHEVLEEHWKEDPPGKRKAYWVGMIQIAVSLYHQRRNNFTGAERMMESALHILQAKREEIRLLGLDDHELIQILSKRLKSIQKNEPYESIHLPINNRELMNVCVEKAKDKNLTWGAVSDLTDSFLVHKHKLRDRKDVIAERKKMSILKNKSRGK